tara:strand:+ start:824 stop:1006 length:183 start_codon:yes stop_codon:yes gene_type:complete
VCLYFLIGVAMKKMGLLLVIVLTMVGCGSSNGMTSQERAADEKAALKSLSNHIVGTPLSE